MEDLLNTLKSEISSAWRFRWWAMAAAWGFCSLGAVVTFLWPDQYEARAVVFVDVSSRLDDVIGGVAIEWNMQEQVERVRQQMLSGPVLETVARETDLDLGATTPQALSALVSSLRQRISITETRPRGADPRQPTDSTLTITFRERSRDTALAVVDTLLSTFVRDVVRGGQGASEVARGFLGQQIAEYQQKLAEREQAIAAFKRDNVGLLPSEAGDYFMRLQTNMQQLDELESQLRTALNRQEALRAQLMNENPSLPPGVSTPGATAAAPAGPLGTLQARIDELETAQADYLLRFTDEHPDVVSTRQQLERLYEQRQDLLTALAASGSGFEGSALATNPVYQQLQIALNDTKVEVAELESQIDEQRRRVNELQARIEVIPEVEARLAGLVRDYDQVKAIHDELVRRLEQERLGTSAVADDSNFSVIEPPIAPFQPTTPNRLLILAALPILGFGVGGAVAYLLSLLSPVFASVKTLREFTDLPVLGSVTLIETPAERAATRVQILGLAASAVLLFVTFIVLIAVREAATSAIQGLVA